MDISVVTLDEFNSATDATSYDMGSSVLTPNKLFFLVAYAGHTAGLAEAPSSITGTHSGLTWVQVATELRSDANNQCITLLRAMGPAPTSGTIVVNFATQQHRFMAQLFELSGIDTSGTNGSGAVVQSTTNDDTSGASFSFNLPGAITAGNASFGFHLANVDTAVFTPGSGYLEIGSQASGTSPSMVRFAQWDSTANQTISGTTSAAPVIVSIGVEVKKAAEFSHGANVGFFTRVRTALSLPGVSGNSVSTPDASAFDITGDIDLRIKLAMRDWTPGNEGTLVAKYQTTGSQRSYRMYLQTGGTIVFAWSIDGINTLTASGWTNTYSANDIKWIRATLDVDDGAAQRVITFYDSDDGASWTTKATVTQAGTTSIFVSDATAPLEIGSINNASGSTFLDAALYYAEVRNGINGSIVATFDSTRAVVSGLRTPTTVSIDGVTWTVNGSDWGWFTVPEPYALSYGTGE